MKSYPSARGCPKPATQNWCPMWGLWLVAEAQHQQAAGWPANGRPQSHMKSDFFSQNNSSNHTIFTRWLTGQLQQCATPSQGTQRTMPSAQGLCPANIGGCWWWCWSPGLVPSKGNPPWERGSPFIPVPEVWTPTDRGCNQWQRKQKWDRTVQWTFCGARGTELYWDATAIKLYI